MIFLVSIKLFKFPLIQMTEEVTKSRGEAISRITDIKFEY